MEAGDATADAGDAAPTMAKEMTRPTAMVHAEFLAVRGITADRVSWTLGISGQRTSGGGSGALADRIVY